MKAAPARHPRIFAPNQGVCRWATPSSRYGKTFRHKDLAAISSGLILPRTRTAGTIWHVRKNLILYATALLGGKQAAEAIDRLSSIIRQAPMHSCYALDAYKQLARIAEERSDHIGQYAFHSMTELVINHRFHPHYSNTLDILIHVALKIPSISSAALHTLAFGATTHMLYNDLEPVFIERKDWWPHLSKAALNGDLHALLITQSVNPQQARRLMTELMQQTETLTALIERLLGIINFRTYIGGNYVQTDLNQQTLVSNLMFDVAQEDSEEGFLMREALKTLARPIRKSPHSYPLFSPKTLPSSILFKLGI